MTTNDIVSHYHETVVQSSYLVSETYELLLINNNLFQFIEIALYLSRFNTKQCLQHVIVLNRDAVNFEKIKFNKFKNSLPNKTIIIYPSVLLLLA